MIKKSPRLHQNYMQAYRDRLDVIKQPVDIKSDESQNLEEQYTELLNHPVFALAAEMEELLLQIRTIENMDEIKCGESGGYKFVRTAFPRLDVVGQHLRVYTNTEDPDQAKDALVKEMKRIFNLNKMKLVMKYSDQENNLLAAPQLQLK